MEHTAAQCMVGWFTVALLALTCGLFTYSSVKWWQVHRDIRRNRKAFDLHDAAFKEHVERLIAAQKEVNPNQEPQ